MKHSPSCSWEGTPRELGLQGAWLPGRELSSYSPSAGSSVPCKATLRGQDKSLISVGSAAIKSQESEAEADMPGSCGEAVGLGRKEQSPFVGGGARRRAAQALCTESKLQAIGCIGAVPRAP